MPLPPPPPGFNLDSPTGAPPLGGRPIIRKGVEPQPKTLKGNFAVDLNSGTAKPVEGLPTEHWRPLAPGDKLFLPNHPGITNEQTGEIRYGPEGPQAAGASPTGDVFQNDVLLDQIAHVRELARKPLTLGSGSTYLSYVPIIGQNAADMQTAITQIKGDLIQRGIQRLRELNGGKGAATMANTEKEGERIANSFAPLSQDQSPEEFIRGLDVAEKFYRDALSKTQPQQPAATPQSQDNGITKSYALPIVDVGPQIAASGTEKAVLDPKIAAIAPQLAQYLNQPKSKVSDAMILGFVKKNGVNPAQWPQLMEALPRRGKVQFAVDPHYNQPLDAQGVIPGTSFLSDKDRAAAADSTTGAVLSGAADVGARGATSDIAGLGAALTGGSFEQGRKEFQEKQDLQAYAHPGATVAGNVVGGLSTLLEAAPKSFLGLLAQAGKQGGLYGFLSSPDASFGGRTKNAIMDATVNTAAAATLDPALRGVGMGARKIGNGVKRLTGTSADDIANADALAAFASHAPNQDVPDMRARFDEQTKLDAVPTGLTTLDRSGQDYLGRQASRSPGARQAADEAAAAAQERVPAQLEADFSQAIDDAAPGKVASFLKRPAREIVADIQGMAGREYEKGIAPIANERIVIDGDLADTLTHERIKGAVSDALSNHTLSDETRAALRQLPRELGALGSVDAPANLGAAASAQIAAAQAQVRDQTLKAIPLTVDGARNIATALDRTASRLAEGSEGGVELRRLSRSIRDKIAEQFPEFQPVNARYASRMRAIGSLEDARKHFLGDTTGRATDDLAKATARMSDKPGEPEFQAGPTGKNGFKIDAGPEPTPSDKQMAMAGARESAVASAKTGAGASTAERLSTPGQKERNRLILGERAKLLEARSKAQAGNVRTTERLQTGGTNDDSGNKVAAGMKAVANLGFHRGGAAIASALSGIRGLGPEDAARVVKLFTDQNKPQFVIDQLEKAYGRRKARFIIARIGAFAATAKKTKPLPAEATESDR